MKETKAHRRIKEKLKIRNESMKKWYLKPQLLDQEITVGGFWGKETAMYEAENQK